MSTVNSTATPAVATSTPAVAPAAPAKQGIIRLVHVNESNIVDRVLMGISSNLVPANYGFTSGLLVEATANVNVGYSYDPKTGLFTPPAPSPATVAQLEGFLSNLYTAKMAQGITVNITIGTTPTLIMVDVSANGLALLERMMRQRAAGQNTFTWYQSTGNVTLTDAQLLQIDSDVTTFIQNMLATWQQYMAAIANKTVNSYLQIDKKAVYPWPVTAY